MNKSPGLANLSPMSNLIEMPKEAINVMNYCMGEFIPGDGAEFKVLSPYNNTHIGSLKESSAENLAAIVEKAKAPQVKWADTPMKERCQVMFRLREILLRDIEKISHRISAECGKTLSEASAEIMKGIEVIEFASSLQNLDVGGKLEVSRGVHCEYRREALGIVAMVTPFNFPSMVPLWMLPIAITLGNALIWKPSEKTPLTSLLIAEATKDAGLPDGILNVVQGGKETVNAILQNPDISAVGFVGSTTVAKYIYQEGSKNLKRVLALGGAKNHILLLPDADPALTGKGIADSFTGCAGQRCMAASVLCAVQPEGTEDRIQKLIEAIKSQAAATTVGDKMGAIISKQSLEMLETAIAKAEKAGAKIILDGRNAKAPENYAGGNWLAPTILDNVKPGSHSHITELFGPVLSIIRCKTLEEALEIQNSSQYGNAVSVFTQNGAVAEEVATKGQAGMVGVNIGVPVPREPFSFGGTFESKFGHGDITGVHSLDFWSNIKKVTTKWAQQKDSNWMS